jgi:hypothetical protein
MAPLRVSLWENTADWKYYFLSGQHIGRAVKKIREEHESQGLGLQRWHTQVDADVLKFETPLWRGRPTPAPACTERPPSRSVCARC